MSGPNRSARTDGLSVPSRLERFLKIVTLETSPRARGWTLALAVLISTVFLMASAVDALSATTGLYVATFTLLALVSLLLSHVVELKTNEPSFEIYPDEPAALSRQVELVRQLSPRTARLIEYSTESIHPLLIALRDTKVNAIQLLICNPSEARTPYQAGRICDGVINLARTFTKQVLVQLQLEIRCYATPASLRGRRFGAEFVSIGWYTYDRRFGDLVDQDQIVGDLNPVVVARHGRPGTLALERMFDEVFNYLWVNSVGVEDACRGLAARPHNFPSKDWLRAVSTAR